MNTINKISFCLTKGTSRYYSSYTSSVSVILRVSWVGSHYLRCGRRQHDSREAAVLVERVQGQRGDAGQRGAVMQAVWVDVGGSGLDVLGCCCRVISGVGSRSVGLQLGVMHELRGDVCLAGVSQGVLHRPLQLHPPVLEPVSDLKKIRRRRSLIRQCFHSQTWVIS